ncbi:DUF2312 domain-containing protein [Sphingomonas melonis]|uniref:DUF2312 domain-containing protein n=1 Tax=Sphingomonas melonis TaxID=152682 RepID=UPI0035C7B08A
MTMLTLRSVRGAGGETRLVPTPYVPPKRGAKARARQVPDPLKTNGNQAAEELRVLIERAERIDEEIDGLQGDKRDVFAEARGRGWSDKAMREIMRIRKLKKEEFQENAALLETYMISLGMI